LPFETAIRTIYYMIKVSIYLGKFSRLASRSCAALYVNNDNGYGCGYGKAEADYNMPVISLLKLGICEGGNVDSTARGADGDVVEDADEIYS
jgi:hypothetical protein